MFRASSAHLQDDTIVYMQHVTVTLYESSWWPVGAQLCTDRPPRTVYRVTVPYAACIQLYPNVEECNILW